jgi:hypothetical protein
MVLSAVAAAHSAFAGEVTCTSKKGDRVFLAYDEEAGALDEADVALRGATRINTLDSATGQSSWDLVQDFKMEADGSSMHISLFYGSVAVTVVPKSKKGHIDRLDPAGKLLTTTPISCN